MKELLSILSRCRSTLVSDTLGALSLMGLLLAALHLPDLL